MATLNLKSSGGMSPAPRTLSFMDGSSYDQFGGQVKAPSVNASAGLPSLTKTAGNPIPPALPTGGSSVADTSQDPMTKFNLGLLDLLKRAQGFDQTKLYNERNRLALAQTDQSMGSADSLGLGGLTPGDALNARQNAGGLYKPEINNLTDRISASVQAVNQFGDAIKAAKEYGAEYAKSIKPDQETINAVQQMLVAGENPGQDVLDSVYKFVDWKAVAAGKAAAKKSGAPSDTKVEKTEKNQAINEVLDKWKGGFIQGNGTVSSTDYKIAKEAWVRKFGQGSAKEFDNEFLGYTDKGGSKWQQDYGVTSTTALEAPNEVRRQDNGDGTTTIYYDDGSSKVFQN